MGLTICTVQPDQSQFCILYKNTIKTVLENEFMVAFKPPTPGALTTDKGSCNA